MRAMVCMRALLSLGVLGRALAQDGGGLALSFLVMGDWGGVEQVPWVSRAELQTAKGMGIVADGIGPKFALALGDNIYFHGIQGDVHCHRFDDTFENVFTAPSLQIPFHVLAGNHDHYGNITAQLAYTDINPRWSFPDLNYTWTETLDDNTTIQFVFVDTVVLAGNSDVYDEHSGELVAELDGDELRGPDDPVLAAAQLEWFNETMKASTADFLIVAGHYPVWSVCEHGPTTQLVAQLKPILERERASVWLNGHDHCAQYIDEGLGVAYHGIGNAAINNPSVEHMKSVPPGSLKFHSQGELGGFASITVTGGGLTVTHHQGDGSMAFSAPYIGPRDKTWLTSRARD